MPERRTTERQNLDPIQPLIDRSFKIKAEIIGPKGFESGLRDIVQGILPEGISVPEIDVIINERLKSPGGEEQVDKLLVLLEEAANKRGLEEEEVRELHTLLDEIQNYSEQAAALVIEEDRKADLQDLVQEISNEPSLAHFIEALKESAEMSIDDIMNHIDAVQTNNLIDHLRRIQKLHSQSHVNTSEVVHQLEDMLRILSAEGRGIKWSREVDMAVDRQLKRDAAAAEKIRQDLKSRIQSLQEAGFAFSNHILQEVRSVTDPGEAANLISLFGQMEAMKSKLEVFFKLEIRIPDMVASNWPFIYNELSAKSLAEYVSDKHDMIAGRWTQYYNAIEEQLDKYKSKHPGLTIELERSTDSPDLPMPILVINGIRYEGESFIKRLNDILESSNTERPSEDISQKKRKREGFYIPNVPRFMRIFAGGDLIALAKDGKLRQEDFSPKKREIMKIISTVEEGPEIVLNAIEKMPNLILDIHVLKVLENIVFNQKETGNRIVRLLESAAFTSERKDEEGLTALLLYLSECGYTNQFLDLAIKKPRQLAHIIFGEKVLYDILYKRPESIEKLITLLTKEATDRDLEKLMEAYRELRSYEIRDRFYKTLVNGEHYELQEKLVLHIIKQVQLGKKDSVLPLIKRIKDNPNDWSKWESLLERF